MIKIRRYTIGTYDMDGKRVEFGRRGGRTNGPYYLYFSNPGGLRGITIQEGRTLEVGANLEEIHRIIRKYSPYK